MDYNERLMLSEPHDILSDFVLCIENGSQFIAYTSAMKLAQWYEQNRDALSALSAKNECKEDETMLADLRRYCKVVKDLDMNEFARLHQEQGETPLYDRGMTYSDMMHFKMVCERIVEKVEPQQGTHTLSDEEMDRFEEMFKTKFTGKRPGYGDLHKTEWLCGAIPNLQSNKDFAIVCRIIYDSKVLKKEPVTFNSFYKEMCQMWNFKYISSYKPSKLHDEYLEKKFAYIS